MTKKSKERLDLQTILVHIVWLFLFLGLNLKIKEGFEFINVFILALFVIYSVVISVVYLWNIDNIRRVWYK